MARAALTRVVEPGDERAGRWLRAPWGRGADGAAHRSGAARRHAARAAGSGASRAIGCGRRRPARSATSTRWRAAGGRFVCPGDPEWPGQLDDLGDARPVGLWVRGRPDLRIWALRSVAVVGARACTPYGAHIAATLGTGLAERGWVVVSGAAHGVDGAAHRGALAAGGATVAVLACGVDVVYPRGHAELIGRIAEQGLVSAELPPGAHPTRSRFVPAQPGDRRPDPGHGRRRGRVPQRLAGHRPRRAAARPLHHGRPGPGRPAGSPRGCTNCCAARPCWSPTPPKWSSWSAASGTSPRRAGDPCCPRDLLDPGRARVLEALPARARSAGRRWPGVPGRQPTRRSAGCTNCTRWVSSNGMAIDWQLARAATPRVERAARRYLTWGIRVKR